MLLFSLLVFALLVRIGEDTAGGMGVRLRGFSGTLASGTRDEKRDGGSLSRRVERRLQGLQGLSGKGKVSALPSRRRCDYKVPRI